MRVTKEEAVGGSETGFRSPCLVGDACSGRLVKMWSRQTVGQESGLSGEVWMGNISPGVPVLSRFPGKQTLNWTFGASCAVYWGMLRNQHLLGVRQRILLRKEMNRSGAWKVLQFSCFGTREPS